MLPAVFDFLNGPVRDLVTQIYDAVGYVGVALWVAIESVIIPIPSELVLPFAGFLVGTGDAVEPLTGQPWSFWLVVLAGTLGATVGAAHRVRDRRVGRSAIDRALGPLRRHQGGRPRPRRDVLRPVWRGRQLLRPDGARHPLAGLVRGGRRPDAARSLRRLLVPRIAAVHGGPGVRRRPTRRRTGSRWERSSSASSTRSWRVLVLVVLAWIWFRIIKPRRAARANA